MELTRMFRVYCGRNAAVQGGVKCRNFSLKGGGNKALGTSKTRGGGEEYLCQEEVPMDARNTKGEEREARQIIRGGRASARKCIDMFFVPSTLLFLFSVRGKNDGRGGGGQVKYESLGKGKAEEANGKISAIWGIKKYLKNHYLVGRSGQEMGGGSGQATGPVAGLENVKWQLTGSEKGSGLSTVKKRRGVCRRVYWKIRGLGRSRGNRFGRTVQKTKRRRIEVIETSGNIGK